MTIKETEGLRDKLQASFDLLVAKIGKIQIGTKKQFPFGWRKAAKGRTVWRILEEIITQNLENNFAEFSLDEVNPSASEVSVYDFECKVSGDATPLFVNIKSAVLGGRKNKDDISKAVGLEAFFAEDVNKQFFVGTFFIQFNDDMTIEVVSATVFPVTWIKDIYVNPSNNGNLQSSKYKNLDEAEKRTNSEFLKEFKKEIAVVAEKRRKKRK